MDLELTLSPGDLKQVNQIYWKFHADNLYIPSAENSIAMALAKDGDRVIAFGMAKLFPEAILILDKSASPRQRTEAFRMLMRHGIKSVKAARHKYLHATIHDEKYGKLLTKHYGFKPSDGEQFSLEL